MERQSRRDLRPARAVRRARCVRAGRPDTRRGRSGRERTLPLAVDLPCAASSSGSPSSGRCDGGSGRSRPAPRARYAGSPRRPSRGSTAGGGCGNRICLAGEARCVATPRMTDPGVDPGLVVRRPVPHRSPSRPTTASVYSTKALAVERRESRLRPECLRQIPVEQRRERLDPLLEQCVDKPVVEVEALLVHRTTAVRHDPGQAIEKRKASSPSSVINFTSSG